MSLWALFQSDNYIRSPILCTRTINIKKHQRASFCTCQKGSYTLEAAVVIPLMAGFLVTILFFFRLLQIQCVVEEALIYTGRKVAVESSVVSSEETLFLSAEGYMLYRLKDEAVVEQYVKYGAIGICLLESDFAGETIELKANYLVDLPISFFGIEAVEMYSQNVFRKWDGDQISEEKAGWVYVTPNGEVYHASSSCRFIKRNVRTIPVTMIESLRGADGQKYYECSRCKNENLLGGMVYYTDYGTLYHRNITCSSLKRTVDKIPISEIGERRPCSSCY